MPLKPPRPCRHCYRLPLPGSPFCAEHQRPVGWEAHQRGRSSTERGYGAAWRRLRLAVLNEEPVCRVCHRNPSTMVDHRIPKAAGGTDERSNLRGICRRCHAIKTGRDRFAPGAVDRLSSGRPETTRASASFESVFRRFKGD